MNRVNSINIPAFIVEGINKTLVMDMPEASPEELDQHRNQMTKAQLMDAYLTSFSGKITGDVIHDVVGHIFGMDLDNVVLLSGGDKETSAAVQNRLPEEAGQGHIPLPRAVIDSRLAAFGKRIAGPEIRVMLNHLFGVNLDAISALENAKISLYSKGQWIVKHDHDLFVVSTGEGDVDVQVYPTSYFIERTGTTELPEDLQHALMGLGYCKRQESRENEGLYYASPDGQAVPDAFKGQTMGAIMATIRSSFAHL